MFRGDCKVDSTGELTVRGGRGGVGRQRETEREMRDREFASCVWYKRGYGVVTDETVSQVGGVRRGGWAMRSRFRGGGAYLGYDERTDGPRVSAMAERGFVDLQMASNAGSDRTRIAPV